jgi:hypothetical protein
MKNQTCTPNSFETLNAKNPLISAFLGALKPRLSGNLPETLGSRIAKIAGRLSTIELSRDDVVCGSDMLKFFNLLLGERIPDANALNKYLTNVPIQFIISSMKLRSGPVSEVLYEIFELSESIMRTPPCDVTGYAAVACSRLADNFKEKFPVISILLETVAGIARDRRL